MAPLEKGEFVTCCCIEEEAIYNVKVKPGAGVVKQITAVIYGRNKISYSARLYKTWYYAML
jgi:hypothetical protein